MRNSLSARLFVSLLVLFMVGLSAVAYGSSDLMISEVAWSGTRASWADEWVELENTSGQTIDLAGWSLSWGEVTVNLGKASQGTLSVNDKTVGEDETVLLERSDDQSVSSVEADVIYKGGLANSGEKLILRNPEGDKVQTVDASKGWMAGTSSGDDPGYASMELVDGKWKTHDSEGNQEDAEGNLIYGTPGVNPESTE